MTRTRLSSTRSGKVYSSFAAEVRASVISPKKRPKASIVTPDLRTTADSASKADKPVQRDDQEEVVICCGAVAIAGEDERGDLVAEMDPEPFKNFEYILDCEADQERIIGLAPVHSLQSPGSPFAYTVCSDADSEASAGFGGWLTYEPPQKSRIYTCTEPALTAGVTIPLLPGVLRNSYGGILYCEPPLQVQERERADHKQAARASGAHGAASSSPRTPLTEHQLIRIEFNRQQALTKLREMQSNRSCSALVTVVQ
jgi:hypothetical protein